MKLLDRHPWFPFVLAFVLLLSAWTSMIVIALKYRPEEVPLQHLQTTQAPQDPSPTSNK